MIDLTYNVVDRQYSLTKKPGQKCSNCSHGSRKLYDYASLPHALCELCNIVFTYSARKLNTGIICTSEMPQLEIINQTYEFLKANRRIPRISELDPDARIIKYPFVDLIKALRLCNKKQKKEFTNIRLFFSDMIDYAGFAFTSMFWKHKVYSEYQFFDVVNNESESIKLNKEQKAIVELYIENDKNDASTKQASVTKEPKPKPKRTIFQKSMF